MCLELCFFQHIVFKFNNYAKMKESIDQSEIINKIEQVSEHHILLVFIIVIITRKILVFIRKKVGM